MKDSKKPQKRNQNILHYQNIRQNPEITDQSTHLITNKTNKDNNLRKTYDKKYTKKIKQPIIHQILRFQNKEIFMPRKIIEQDLLSN